MAVIRLGRRYDFHQMLGHLDFQMGVATEMLSEAGTMSWPTSSTGRWSGRNVLDGRWTFQMVEEFEDIYYEPIRAIEKSATSSSADGATPSRPR